MKGMKMKTVQGQEYRLTHTFRIVGNQEDRAGNPIPYTRTMRFSKAHSAKRYFAWQHHVRAAFIGSLNGKVLTAFARERQPIVLEDLHAFMDIIICFDGENHGDSDNVWKGIADSLFFNDKHVAGSFEYIHGSRGWVDVNIWIQAPALVEPAKRSKIHVTKMPNARLSGT